MTFLLRAPMTLKVTRKTQVAKTKMRMTQMKTRAMTKGTVRNQARNPAKTKKTKTPMPKAPTDHKHHQLHGWTKVVVRHGYLPLLQKTSKRCVLRTVFFPDTSPPLMERAIAWLPR